MNQYWFIRHKILDNDNDLFESPLSAKKRRHIGFCHMLINYQFILNVKILKEKQKGLDQKFEFRLKITTNIVSFGAKWKLANIYSLNFLKFWKSNGR